MPCYYLHLHKCGALIPDDEGQDLADDAAARAEALSAARWLMAEEIRAGRLCLACFIVIADEHGREIGRLAFADAVQVTGVGI